MPVTYSVRLFTFVGKSCTQEWISYVRATTKVSTSLLVWSNDTPITSTGSSITFNLVTRIKLKFKFINYLQTLVIYPLAPRSRTLVFRKIIASGLPTHTFLSIVCPEAPILLCTTPYGAIILTSALLKGINLTECKYY